MPNVVRLDVPADVRYVRMVSACVGELLAARDHGTEADRHDVVLALQEACMNIVDHAYAGRSGGRIALDLTVAPGAFMAELTDRGASFDPDSVPEPDLCNGQVRGYGLFLMRALLDEVTYTSAGGENRWRLVKRFS
jgi:serine/threonine-protein kinase RsbW